GTCAAHGPRTDPARPVRAESGIRDTRAAWALFRAWAAALDGAMQSTVPVGVGAVSFGDLVAVARHGAGVELAPDALAAIQRAREVVEDLAAATTPTYGIST